MYEINECLSKWFVAISSKIFDMFEKMFTSVTVVGCPPHPLSTVNLLVKFQVGLANKRDVANFALVGLVSLVHVSDVICQQAFGFKCLIADGTGEELWFFYFFTGKMVLFLSLCLPNFSIYVIFM